MVWGCVVVAIGHVLLVHNLSLDVTDMADGHHKTGLGAGIAGYGAGG